MTTMSREQQIDEARALMLRFAERTGVEGEGAPRRYLWTDAFAVANAIALFEATGDAQFSRLALALVEQVHGVLGRHRPDDARRGWLSGLDDEVARQHPTCAGLRIGKPLPERTPNEAFDEWLEWNRDGQYFHYLTRWMHALDRVARFRGEAHYNVWARELFIAAHRGFVARGMASQPLRMYWKMSIDLSRPLVFSMGQHDPLDGLVTGLELRATADALHEAPDEPRLEPALADFAALSAGREIATPDPLGLGGLLMDAGRLAQLRLCGAIEEEELFQTLLDGACRSLRDFASDNELDRPASERLAFRELGLAIGLSALDPIEQLASDRPVSSPREIEMLRRRLEVLRQARPIGDAIRIFWLDPGHREVPSWREHVDINEVMLATALVPEGWVGSSAGTRLRDRGPTRHAWDASATSF
jgi:hypothetical protein